MGAKSFPAMGKGHLRSCLDKIISSQVKAFFLLPGDAWATGTQQPLPEEVCGECGECGEFFLKEFEKKKDSGHREPLGKPCPCKEV